MNLKQISERVDKIFPDHYQQLQWNCLVGFHGSIAYGTYVDDVPGNENFSSDIDVMGIIIPPLNYYFGLSEFGTFFPKSGTRQFKQDGIDVVVYELRKFVQLATQGNPSVLTLLWNLPEHYIYKTGVGHSLILNRDMFLGKHVFNAFAGYATQQFQKMQQNKINHNTGEKRKKIIEEFGYDCENAAHLIRILRMGIEFMRTGNLRVFRDDFITLLDIKRGYWSLEEIIGESDTLFAQLQTSFDNSSLPPNPDYEKIDTWLTETLMGEMK